jgi:hypothetical protein
LLRLPDTSSAHGITRRLNTGRPEAIARVGCSDEPALFSVRNVVKPRDRTTRERGLVPEAF